jgi:hypothetical protein
MPFDYCSCSFALTEGPVGFGTARGSLSTLCNFDGKGLDMFVRKIVSAVALAALLGACAGRDPAPPQPVAMGTDQNLNCPALFAEMTANNTRIAALQSEESSKRGQNVAAGVVGAVLFWPALFFMDFKDAAGKDRQNVEARQQYLQTIYAQKTCANGETTASR